MTITTTATIPTTREQLAAMVAAGQLIEHHTANRRGYVSRKGSGIVEPYAGRFGAGYVLVSPRWDTTQYVDVTYYVAR